jgi:hypothetical protein
MVNGFGFSSRPDANRAQRVAAAEKHPQGVAGLSFIRGNRFALDDRKVDFDLVEPTRMIGFVQEG